MQFRVGVVVFATMIVGGLLASLNGPLPMGWLPWGHAKYQIGIEVPQAPGVDTNTPVRKNGILIGRVKSIEDKDGGVLLKADIDGNRPLFTDFEPHIRTTVLGDATIDFLSKRPAPGCAARAEWHDLPRTCRSESIRIAWPIGRLERGVRRREPIACPSWRRSVEARQPSELGVGRR